MPRGPKISPRARREARQRQVLDLYALHRDPARVAAALGLEPAELEALVDRLALRRRVQALLRGELTRYPPLRPREVPAQPVTPLRRRPAPAPPEPPAPTPPAEIPHEEQRALLSLYERCRGDRPRVARALGIPLEALEARVDALGVRPEVERLRAQARRRERERSDLADRLEQVLHRAGYLADLGALWPIDRDVRERVGEIWRRICAESPSDRAARAALKNALGIDDAQVRRLLTRYDLAFQR